MLMDTVIYILRGEPRVKGIKKGQVWEFFSKSQCNESFSKLLEYVCVHVDR